MGYMLNGVTTGGLPMHLVKPLLDEHEVPYFVETGTAGGMSVKEASKLFKRCWTIELIKDRPDFNNSHGGVHFEIGDSAEILPRIIADLKEIKFKTDPKARQWVLFFLDAHYCGDVPNESGYPECPLLDEIKCVAEYGEDAVIIIDDARLFLGSPPHPNEPTEWPCICDIFHLLREKFPYHYISIVDDYVIAIPIHLRHTIDKEWRDRFHIRYPNAEDKLKSQVKDVYAAFKNYIQ
jgi:hypothetical protein